MIAPPVIERIKLDPARRHLQVTRVECLTPMMRRITLTGETLSTFESPAFDDHIKLIFDDSDSGALAKRDFTPRAFSRRDQTLVIDFALHGRGAANDWAASATIGSRLSIAGPKASKRIASSVTRWLLIGDETALPAIGRFVETAATDNRVTVIAATTAPNEQQSWASRASVDVTWVHRSLSDAANPKPLLDAVQRLNVPDRTFVWIAAEAGVSKAVRSGIEAGGVPATWLKSSGYWVADPAAPIG